MHTHSPDSAEELNGERGNKNTEQQKPSDRRRLGDRAKAEKPTAFNGTTRR